MLTSKAFAVFYKIFNLLPIHREYLMFGWFINLIFGVAYWMFPRFTPGKSDMDKPRGFVWAAWGALIVLNIGLVVFTVAEVVEATFLLRFIARSLEITAILLFAINLWPRTKPISEPD
jgi:hypothetical protein